MTTEETYSVKRVRVPGDNSCLFYAVGYLCENLEPNEATQKKLRRVVTEDAEKDEDRTHRELLLERTIEEYAEWIANEFHEGGEQEIIALAKHYEKRLAVVSTQSLTVLAYGDSGDVGYVLYTGTHYDALVGVDADGSERKLFEAVLPSFEESCLAMARRHNDTVERRNRSERIYRIRCNGCGVRLEDSAAFQKHCSTVDHDDDFAFDCEEIFEVTHDNPEGDTPAEEEEASRALALALAEREQRGGPARRTRAQLKSLVDVNGPSAKKIHVGFV